MSDNMLTNLVDRILMLSEIKTVEVNDIEYADRQLHAIRQPLPVTLQSHTLQSVVDYIACTFNDDPPEKPEYTPIIFVESPLKVTLTSQLDDTNQRMNDLTAICKPCGFDFGTFVSVEKFIIDAQACFQDSPDRAEILKLVGNLVAESIKTAEDNGITQKTVVQKTSASRAHANVPNPVTLKPYRTFREVEQPGSQFIFRLKFEEKNGEFYAGLWPADGDAWELKAILNIREWLRSKTNVPILA